MKRIYISHLILALTCLASCSDEQATAEFLEIRGVPIETKVHSHTFYADWNKDPINAFAEDLDQNEIQRSFEAMRQALSKYPQTLLDNVLDRIYILKNLEFYGTSFGGTYCFDDVYLNNLGRGQGYTMLFLEASFHHEFSSILLQEYAFPYNEWSALNPPGFTYKDGGLSALINNTYLSASLEEEKELNKQGFLNKYSISDIEEDINTYSEWIFSEPEKFQLYMNTYPQISKKFEVWLQFYHSINPHFTKSFFLDSEKRFILPP